MLPELKEIKTANLKESKAVFEAIAADFEKTKVMVSFARRGEPLLDYADTHGGIPRMIRRGIYSGVKNTINVIDKELEARSKKAAEARGVSAHDLAKLSELLTLYQSRLNVRRMVEKTSFFLLGDTGEEVELGHAQARRGFLDAYDDALRSIAEQMARIGFDATTLERE